MICLSQHRSLYERATAYFVLRCILLLNVMHQIRHSCIGTDVRHNVKNNQYKRSRHLDSHNHFVFLYETAVCSMSNPITLTLIPLPCSLQRLRPTKIQPNARNWNTKRNNQLEQRKRPGNGYTGVGGHDSPSRRHFDPSRVYRRVAHRQGGCVRGLETRCASNMGDLTKGSRQRRIIVQKSSHCQNAREYRRAERC